MGIIKDFIAEADESQSKAEAEPLQQIEMERQALPKLADLITELSHELAEVSPRYSKRIQKTAFGPTLKINLGAMPGPIPEHFCIEINTDTGEWHLIRTISSGPYSANLDAGQVLRANLLSYNGDHGLEAGTQRIQMAFLKALQEWEKFNEAEESSQRTRAFVEHIRSTM